MRQKVERYNRGREERLRESEKVDSYSIVVLLNIYRQDGDTFCVGMGQDQNGSLCLKVLGASLC